MSFLGAPKLFSLMEARAAILMVMILTMTSGCKLDDNRLKGSIRGLPPTSEPPSTPENIILSSNHFLAISTQIPSDGLSQEMIEFPGIVDAPINTPLGGATTVTTGTVPTLSPLTIEIFPAPAPDHQAPAVSDIASDSTSATLTLSGSFVSGITWLCETLAPFNHVPCHWPSFAILRSDLGANSDLQVKVYPQDYPDLSVNSQALRTHSFRIEQISNTTHDNSTDDDPAQLVAHNDNIYFFAQSVAGFFSARKMNRYNSVDKTLTQITNLQSTQVNDSNMIFIHLHQERLYFSGYNPSPPRTRLFSWAEGEALPTSHSFTTNKSGTTDNPHNLISMSDKLFFAALNRSSESGVGEYTKIFSFDFDSNQLLQRVNTSGSQTISDAPVLCASFNNKLFFIARNSSGGRKLYSFADSTDTLTQVSNTRSNNSENDLVEQCQVLGDQLYFRATNSSGAVKLYAYNDTIPELKEISNTSEDSSLSDNPDHLMVYEDQLYFSAQNSGGITKLYRFDGEKIFLVSDTSGSALTSDDPAPKFGFNGQVYFYALNLEGARKLFALNNQTGAVHQVSNTRKDQGLDDFPNSSYGYFAAYNERIYFWARNHLNVNKLFVYDPITHQLAQVANTRQDNSLEDSTVHNSGIYPGGHSGQMLVVNGQLYFKSRNAQGGTKLFALCDEELGC